MWTMMAANPLRLSPETGLNMAHLLVRGPVSVHLDRIGNREAVLYHFLSFLREWSLLRKALNYLEDDDDKKK